MSKHTGHPRHLKNKEAYEYDVPPGPKLKDFMRGKRRNPQSIDRGSGIGYRDFLQSIYTPKLIVHPNPIKGRWTYPEPGIMQWRKNA